MASRGEATLPPTRRTRKSIGGGPATRKSGDGDNATADVGTALAAARKKSRSKSIGPGGFDALKMGNGNRRASLAVFSGPPPRSILKPTIPVVAEIPSYKPKQTRASNSVGNEVGGTKVALRTEEEQQAAAREREERERAEMEKEIKDRREARRKSLANRRVSFAAEATLHTFHEIEELQDSTASTDSTRRAAQSPALQHQQHPNSDPPSTPPDYDEEHEIESPANQRDLHQRKRRRSSAASTYSEEDTNASTVYDSDLEHADSVAEIQGEELTNSSDSEEDGTVMTVEAEEMTSASVASARSEYSPGSTGSLDANLRLAARMAATQGADDEEEEVIAGFAGWGRKNHSQENISHVKESQVPENRENADDQGSDMEMDMDTGMDMTNAVGGILYPQLPSPDKDDEVDEDMSMDVTTALGGILSKAKAFLRRKSANLASQQEPEEFGEQTMEMTTAVGGIHHDRFFDDDDDDQTEIAANEEMSMEFTAALGNLLPGGFSRSRAQIGEGQAMALEDDDGDEGAMMDMTMPVGRILPGEVEDEDGDQTMGMDMTLAVGGIIKPAQTPEEEEGDQTMGMDMTMVVGGIIKPADTPEARSAARKVMEEEADEPVPTIAGAPQITPSPKRSAPTIADENDSPWSSAIQGTGLRRSLPRAVSPTARLSGQPSSSPVRRASAQPSSSPVRRTPAQPSSSPVRRTPAQPSNSPVRRTPAQPSSSPVRRAPSPNRTTTQGQQSPTRTPPFPIRSPSSSPMRIASSPVKTPRSPPKSKLFHQNPSTGISTPRIVLTPQGRRLSGVGADRLGLGSPRVAEIFDRRESIGEAATDFVPSLPANPRRTVAFTDPRVMEAEVDRERQDEQSKEDNRMILEREVNGSPDDRDTALNLREMIQGLSPKKNIFRGRKSLHVGSALGLLGKRPAELDDDDDESEDQDGVKRLKGHQGSPVKNIRLQSPPSKAETTTGRKIRASIKPTDSARATPTLASSPQRATTPRSQGRFGDVGDDQPSNAMDFEHTIPMDEAETQQEDDGERVHLQDFLNMTSIRFMELTTTKRRHTIAPGPARDSTAADGKDDVSLEGCVVAGACTVPMLELYQHSCRELKKYISEGRRIVREIETETFEENPPLFREYMTASPEVKVLMDNQFKNVKTHARLLSKAMWYEWRMKLQEGLMEGLLKTSEGMDNDDRLLKKQQELLSSVLPDMVKRFEALELEHENLEAVAKELADCDPQDLEDARAELAAVDESIAEKTKKVEELRRALDESEGGIESLTKQKQQCLDEIKEADKIREECRGWSSTEINKLKAQTDKIEKQHGWAIAGISGTTISLRYKREIELIFDITQQQKQNQIDLRYIPSNPSQPAPTPEKEFFLHHIRQHLLRTASLKPPASRLLGVVSTAWDKADAVTEQIRRLRLSFPTSVSRTGDGGEGVMVTASVLLVPLRTRVEVGFVLGVKEGSEEGVEVVVEPEAKVVYGEGFAKGKMGEFLRGRVAGRVGGGCREGEGGWDETVLGLARKLLSKGAAVSGQK